MGYDFKCMVGTHKIVCLIFLIISSVLILQHFELLHMDMDAISPFSYSGAKKDTDKMSILETNLAPSSSNKYEFSSVSGISPSPSPIVSRIVSGISPSPSPTVSRIAPSPSTSTIAGSEPPLCSRKNDTVLILSDRNSRIAPSPSLSTSSWKSEHSQSPPPPEKNPSVVTISDMEDMLIRSRGSSYSKVPLWASDADRELSVARSEIEHSPATTDHPGLYEPVFRNLSLFLRSYEVMEEKLKIYIYNDGKGPVFLHPKLQGIYASEGWFMKQLQTSTRFLTSDPEKAHLFYLPFSSKLLVDFVYVPDSHTFKEINEYLKNYVDTIKTRHSFWNRTDGRDHFLVACHDWAPTETRELMPNCIRALCNSDINDGFQFGRDISLPETSVHSIKNPSRGGGGAPPSKRKILAFFAGQMHGYLRPILLRYWENKDPDMKIVGKMRKGYEWHMKNSKYCICAKGYEVNSPRVVEAIMSGCVPVIISDGFVPPFFGVLKWDSFAVFVLERDIPKLKEVLVSIPERRYAVLQRRVKMVRRHFLWHGDRPEKYDIFHMILHSIWYNRVLQVAPKQN